MCATVYTAVRQECTALGVRNRLFDLPTLDSHIVHPICPAGARNTPSTLRPQILTLVDEFSELSEKMVYKLSYQTGGQTSEGTISSGCLGQFGIIDVCDFHICSPEESLGFTMRYIKDSTLATLGLGRQYSRVAKEYLYCTAMTLECLPLLDISVKR